MLLLDPREFSDEGGLRRIGDEWCDRTWDVQVCKHRHKLVGIHSPCDFMLSTGHVDEWQLQHAFFDHSGYLPSETEWRDQPTAIVNCDDLLLTSHLSFYSFFVHEIFTPHSIHTSKAQRRLGFGR